MSHSYKADWDMCWYSQSDSGCRNSHCTWRHEKLSDGHYQYHQQNHENLCGRDSREKSDAPFYPVQQCKNWRMEDQYLLDHPDIYNISRAKKQNELCSKLPHKLKSEYYRPVMSPMSESSSVKTPVLISSSSSMITSQGSDSDCDKLKNVLDLSAGELTKVQKANSEGFLQDVLTKLQTPRRQLKLKSNPGTKSESSLSPYAKVFVPSVEKLTLRESSAVAGEITQRNRSMIITQQLPNYNSGETLIGKVYE